MKPITMLDSRPCDWPVLPLLLPTPTTWFSPDHKRLSRKWNQKKCKRSDSSNSDPIELMTPLTSLVFDFHYVISSLMTPTMTATMALSLVKTSSKDKEGTVLSTTNLKIRKSWSISESPWNNGFFVTISANIHPTLQISTGQAYLWHPNKTSGARYHSVTTWNYWERLDLMFNRLKFCGTETAHDVAVHVYTTSAFQFHLSQNRNNFCIQASGPVHFNFQLPYW